MLSAHVEVGPGVTDVMAFRQRVEVLLHDRFGIDHITIQLEDERRPCATESASQEA